MRVVSVCTERNTNQTVTTMANFAKIKVGNDSLDYFFNLDAIESVDIKNKRVYTVGADQPYHIYDEDTWRGILHYIDTNRCPSYMF